MSKSMRITVVAGLIAALATVSACNSNGKRPNPGKTYAPDMAYSRAYESYTSNPNFEDGLTNRMPVSGAVAAHGALPDHLKEGDTSIYAMKTVDYKFTAEELAEGKRIYDIQCGICHGQNLDGQGPLFTSGKYAAMPANFKGENYLKMSVGQMYYAIKFGKNMMGSYASALDVKQRWQIIAYIKQVQAENGGDAFTMLKEETATTGSDDAHVAHVSSH